jgi:hypothetical protein
VFFVLVGYERYLVSPFERVGENKSKKYFVQYKMVRFYSPVDKNEYSGGVFCCCVSLLDVLDA